jgi:hypothetical protein
MQDRGRDKGQGKAQGKDHDFRGLTDWCGGWDSNPRILRPRVKISCEKYLRRHEFC